MSDQLWLVAAVFAGLPGLLPKPTPPPWFFFIGAVSAWGALVFFELIRHRRARFIPSGEFLAGLSFAVGCGIFLLLQHLYLFAVWPRETAFGIATCVLGWIVASRLNGKNPRPDREQDSRAGTWMEGSVLLLALSGARALQQDAPVPAWAPVAIAVLWLLLGSKRVSPLGEKISRASRTRNFGWIATKLAGAFLPAGIAAAVAGHSPALRPLAALFPVACVAMILLQRVKERLDARATDPVAELLRLAVLLGAGAVLVMPLVTFHPVGGGDAGWYATMLRDAITQFRAGVFPVYIGQTADAFNGSVFPFALAPYLLHFGGLLDLLTLHSLGTFAILHLAAVVSLLGGLFVMHAAVRALNPEQPAIALAAAVLYAASPGVMAPLYTSDMYMTVMTLPWVPLAIFCSLRAAMQGSRAAWIGVGASVGILCWAHFPVAVWTGLVCALPLAGRLVAGPVRKENFVSALLGGVVFAGISAGYFARIMAVMEMGEEGLNPIRGLMLNLKSVMPATLLPVSAQASLLSDFQLGYSAALLLALALLFCWRRGQGASRWLVFGGLLLLLLLLPIPSITETLWRSLPTRLVVTSDVWPMQRLYLVLAALACLTGSIACSHLAASRFFAPLLRGILVVAIVWSTREAGKFLLRGRLTTNPAPSVSSVALGSNSRLTNNSFYPYFPGRALPHYFSDGPVDPEFALRLLDPGDPAKILRSNEPVAGSSPPQTVALHAQHHPMWPVIVDLTPRLDLPPHSRSILHFRFPPRNYQGRFHLQGKWMDRQYTIPAPPISGPTFMLRNDQPETETLIVRYYPDPNAPTPELAAADPAARASSSLFAEVDLIPYRSASLPMAIESFLPLRIRVEAPAAGLLETFRMAVPGYRSRVNGTDAPTGVSRDALVTVPVPAGRSVVELDYRAPGITRATNWLSLALALGVGVWCFRRAKSTQGVSAP